MSQNTYIPFNKPYVAPNTINYVKEALNSDHQQGGGPFNKKAAQIVKEINGGGEVFLTSSCTQALEMATILLDLKPGDEVIMPSYTFTSAATALVNYGVIPVFIDIEPTHLNIDPNKVREAITSRTKAISIVNYAGYACDFESLDSIAQEFGLFKIEDNAHGFGTTSNGYKLGTWGDLATLSFHATKNIQCGEGGALIVNNKEFLNRAFLLQEKGTNRREFIKGEVNKYQWVDKGGSYLISEMTSAMLYAQLMVFTDIQNNRKKTYSLYENYLADNQFFRILNHGEMENQSSHMFALLIDKKHREKILSLLAEFGIRSTSHYQPLHNSLAGRRYTRNKNIDISLEISMQICRLPLWYGLDQYSVEYIADKIKDLSRCI